jgi:integrase
MLGHTRRILKLLSPDPGQGVLATVARAMGKETPAASRRYDTIWEIDRLFEWIRSHWAENATLPLEELQTKAMILIMVYSACRLAELGRMERPAGYKAGDATMTLTTTLKQRQDMRQQVTVRRISRKELCAVEAAEWWIARAPPTADTRLFHQLERTGIEGAEPKAGQPLTTAQIAPRLVKAMRAAGIPPQYTAYSIKPAVVTKLYRMGATDEQVVEYGHWAKGSSTPRKWYNIATVEEEWLGAKLLGETMGLSEESALEKFVSTYMAPARTETQAEERARAAEALATPTTELQKCIEAEQEMEDGAQESRE